MASKQHLLFTTRYHPCNDKPDWKLWHSVARLLSPKPAKSRHEKLLHPAKTMSQIFS